MAPESESVAPKIKNDSCRMDTSVTVRLNRSTGASAAQKPSVCLLERHFGFSGLITSPHRHLPRRANGIFGQGYDGIRAETERASQKVAPASVFESVLLHRQATPKLTVGDSDSRFFLDSRFRPRKPLVLKGKGAPKVSFGDESRELWGGFG